MYSSLHFICAGTCTLIQSILSIFVAKYRLFHKFVCSTICQSAFRHARVRDLHAYNLRASSYYCRTFRFRVILRSWWNGEETDRQRRQVSSDLHNYTINLHHPQAVKHYRVRSNQLMKVQTLGANIWPGVKELLRVREALRKRMR